MAENIEELDRQLAELGEKKATVVELERQLAELFARNGWGYVSFDVKFSSEPRTNLEGFRLIWEVGITAKRID